ncbi:MAG: aldehyde ferredoxin oxidoreductase family protein [Candidatus Thermoplasmatota archaeon]
MKGYIGKILRVDLKEKKLTIEKLDKNIALRYIGGRGFGVNIMFNEVSANVEPLSPENKLIFATGPLTGTLAPASSRYSVVSKSPLTDTISTSNSGGFFGPMLKKAGFDAIIFEAKAKDPCYLFMDNGKPEIRSAKNIWGLDTNSTTDYIIEEVGKANVACIGIAGENLVKISAIINDKHRAIGRGGLGAVMGSKKLKAIACIGDKKIEVANEKGFEDRRKEALLKLKESEITESELKKYGTAVLVNIINEHGIFPTKNFQYGFFENAEKISGEKIAESILIKKKSCFNCSIACTRVTKVNDKVGEGPEYETIWAFGADCGIDNISAIAKANYLCNELGLDTISTGATIACAMELSEKKIINEKIEFGDENSIIELTQLIAKREGIGRELCEGSYRFAKKYNATDYSMSVKKMELPAYDPRGAKGHGLAYATSNRGGCHLKAYMISPEILGHPTKLDPFDTEYKAEFVKTFQDITAVIDSTGMCLFTSFALGIEDYLLLLRSATGIKYKLKEILKVGERIWNTERIFNIKAGLTRDEDSLPLRLRKEKIPYGPAEGNVWEGEKMLDEYYKLRGWNEKGEPKKYKLSKLGLL